MDLFKHFSPYSWQAHIGISSMQKSWQIGTVLTTFKTRKMTQVPQKLKQEVYDFHLDFKPSLDIQFPYTFIL